MSRSSLPASCRELDLAVVEAALVKHRCNAAAAARALGVPASDLRRLVTWGPLAAAVSEQVEQAIDRAEAVLLDGLDSPDVMMRLKAASALLRLSPAGRRRGFGRGGAVRQNGAAPMEDVTLKGAWAGPGAIQLFEHAMCDVARLPVREVVSATHYVTDLTLGLGEVVFDYLQDA